MLRDRLAELGHAPAYAHELVGIDQDATGVHAWIATPAGERTVQARYLSGTDDASSFVRRTMGIDFPGKTLGVRVVAADVVVDGVTADFWHTCDPGTPAQVSLCPLY